MDFNAAVDKFMPDVREGSNEPRLFYRDNSGEWHCDHIQNQYGDTFDWVEDSRAADPLALEFTGAEFSNGSFPHVYDTILAARIRAEYYTCENSNKDIGELRALTYFLSDNISELSSETTEYISQFDRPLAELYKMLPSYLSLYRSDEHYDSDTAWQAFEVIEDRIALLIQRSEKDEVAMPAKRNIEGYEEKVCIEFSGKEIVIAENPAAEQPYLLCSIRYDNPLGMEERYDGIVSNDYVEIMREFTKRIDGMAAQLEADRRESGLPIQVMTDKDCLPNSQSVDWNGKTLIIKPETLAPEFRSAENQYVVCTGGFGASPNSRGSKVYVKELFSDKECYYRSHQIAGIADPAKMPQWAADKLAEHTKQRESDAIKDKAATASDKKCEKSAKKPSLLGKLDDNKQKVERDKAVHKDKPATKNRGGQEVTN